MESLSKEGNGEYTMEKWMSQIPRMVNSSTGKVGIWYTAYN